MFCWMKWTILLNFTAKFNWKFNGKVVAGGVVEIFKVEEAIGL